jgi:hypothetical protein
MVDRQFGYIKNKIKTPEIWSKIWRIFYYIKDFDI